MRAKAIANGSYRRNQRRNVIKRAGVDVSNFIVTVNDAEGKQMQQWKFAEMPE